MLNYQKVLGKFAQNILGRLFYMLTEFKLTVCYFRVTYAFQSESTLYSCLDVKELFARNRHDVT